MSELERLRQSDIPAGRQRLREQHGNLLRVADYCHGNYLQAGDKRKALEETMALSTQSLASVTYQVSSVATAFLRLLELLAAQLRRVESDIACVAQSVDMHEEKVSRREIGALAVTRRFLSCQKVVAPPNPPVLEPYHRKPLNFSALDDIGHGVKDTSTQLSRTGTLARRSAKSCSAQAGGAPGRSGRVPGPVQPPVVPAGKFPSGSCSSSPLPLRSSGAPAAPGDGIPAPPPLPGTPLLAPSPPGPAAAIPAPPPLPGDLLPPLPGDLLPPHPGDLLPPHPGDLLPPIPRDLLPPHPRDLLPPHPGDLLPPHTRDLLPPIPRDLLPPHTRDLLPPVPGDLLPPHPRDLLPPIPRDLLPPHPGDLPVSPAELLSPAPGGPEPLPPPPAVPDFGDLDLPPPPDGEEPPWAPESCLEKALDPCPGSQL
nr:ABI gene family member 3 [Taeniopygia guttata]